MKQINKSIISILLAITVITECFTIAFAEENTGSATEETTVENTEGTTDESPEEIPDEPPTEPGITEPAEKEDDDVIGKIYLCSRWSGITTTGHLWIYIHNTSDEPITVGLLEVAPDDGISMATFGFTRSDGFGIYYNMETYRNDKYCDASCISLCDDLTVSELEKVSKKLLNSNQWNPFINCVFFACSIWNSAGNTFIMPFTYPPVTRLFIKMAGGTETCQMVNQPAENTFKQRGVGKNSYLDPLSEKSLAK